MNKCSNQRQPADLSIIVKKTKFFFKDIPNKCELVLHNLYSYLQI